MGGSCSLGEGYRENDIVSQGSGGTHQASLEDISREVAGINQEFWGIFQMLWNAQVLWNGVGKSQIMLGPLAACSIRWIIRR